MAMPPHQVNDLPSVPWQRRSQSPRETPAELIQRRRKLFEGLALAERILIADDDSVSGRVLAQVLGLSGYEVFVAEDGFDALLRIEEHQPDLLISDLRMPRDVRL